jgi:hypothetical protein
MKLSAIIMISFNLAFKLMNKKGRFPALGVGRESESESDRKTTVGAGRPGTAHTVPIVRMHTSRKPTVTRQ